MRALVESLNDRIAHNVHDLISPLRNRWVARQRASAGVSRDFVITRHSHESEFSFLLVGDTGEQDASQYAVVAPLLKQGESTAFMVICSDVIYPAGDVNEYVNGFYLPYEGYGKPIYAVPGNHDWYDGLNGFMYHFCGAEPLPEEVFRWSDFKLREIIARAIWRRPSLPKRDCLEGWRSSRPPWSNDPPEAPQTGPYFVIETKSLTIVGIDTGITGNLDHEQGEWLLRVSKRPGAKILLTGKPLLVDGDHRPCAIAWSEDRPPAGRPTVDDIVRDPEHEYVAAIGGNIHNYQRYSVPFPPSRRFPNGRDFEYIVSGGGGAYLSATHRIPYVDVTLPGSASGTTGAHCPRVTESDFYCYPLRGDSLAHFSKRFVPKIRGVLSWAVPTTAVVLAGLVGRVILPDDTWRWGMLGLAVLSGTCMLGYMYFVKRRRHGKLLQRGLWVGLLLTGLMSVALWAVDNDDIWQWTLIALSVLLLLIGAAWTVIKDASMVGWLAMMSIGAAGLTAFAVLNDVSDLRRAAIAAAGFVVFGLLLRLGFFIRFQARSKSVAAVAAGLWGVPVLVIGAMAQLWDGEVWRHGIAALWQGDAWRIAIAELALLVLVVAAFLSVYLLVLVRVWPVLVPPRGRKSELDADEAAKIMHERMVSQARERGCAPPSPVRPSAADAQIDNWTEAVARVLLPRPGGRWLVGKLRHSQSLVSDISSSDEPPMFKNFLRLDVTPDDLTVKTYGVTGWSDHEQNPPREDCVRIKLREQ
ncbi:MAG TPA: metallophosphoesterase [Thermoleophilaceae bacterium]|jgi:hypothetical protein